MNRPMGPKNIYRNIVTFDWDRDNKLNYDKL